MGLQVHWVASTRRRARSGVGNTKVVTLLNASGDVLSGICATAAVWASRSEDICLAEAAVFASVIVRYASRLAFKKNGRSTLTSDMLSYIGEATEEIYTRSEFLCIR